MMSRYPPLQATARNSRTTARKEAASYIKKTFFFTCGQINFDGKLLQELGGTEKVNRLAVVAVQEEENQLLCHEDRRFYR